MATINIKTKADLTKLRRHALAAQGLLQSQPFGRGLSGARKAIDHIGYVQIDTISVVERAHHHVFRSRVPNFTPDMTNKLLRDRSIFEYWSHAAAFLPMQDYRFSLPYKHSIKSGKKHWFRSRDTKLMAQLKKRIANEGPLRSRDVEDAKGNGAGWWEWKPAKKALEQMYMEGDLMVTDRQGFQKTYDLPERVLPADLNILPPSSEELAQHILEQQLRCHGFASLKGITYQRRNPELRQAMKALVEQHLNTNGLDTLILKNGERYFCAPQLLDKPTPRASHRLQILSPFDNAVIQRERLSALFDYDYQIECYVPEPKREYGYFCLPLLYRDQFIGRMDCKVHRKDKHLEIRALYLEDHTFEQDAVADALEIAVRDFAEFQNSTRISLTNVYPKKLSKTLNSLLTH